MTEKKDEMISDAALENVSGGGSWQQVGNQWRWFTQPNHATATGGPLGATTASGHHESGAAVRVETAGGITRGFKFDGKTEYEVKKVR